MRSDMYCGPASASRWSLTATCLSALTFSAQVSGEGAVIASATTTLDVVQTADRPERPKGTAGTAAYIRANESASVDVCLDYVDAQFRYSAIARNAHGKSVFAQRILSTPGTHDGLFWPITTGEDESPAGPRLAAAAFAEQQSPRQLRPLSGYYFKLLTAQGGSAPGGALDYRVSGSLVNGFALIAWPAKYGVSGVRTFIVNHLGIVYATNLGPYTARIASSAPVFDPDWRWINVATAAEDK